MLPISARRLSATALQPVPKHFFLIRDEKMKAEGLYALAKDVEPSFFIACSFDCKGSAWLRAMRGFLFVFMVAVLFVSCDGDSEVKDVERLSAEVYGMRQCQRKADNINFYLHKYNAEKIFGKYEGKEALLSDTNLRSFMLARGRYSIVYSDYLLQIGSKQEAIKVIDALSRDRLFNLNVDTLLWLNYLAHQGRVNYYPYNLSQYRPNVKKGYDCLIQCYFLASRNNITTYKAVSMQLLSHYLINDSIFQIAKQFDSASLRYINEDGVADSLLAGNLAERALRIFLNQKDFYLTANAWRTLARCYFHIGDAHNSIECLNNALANPVIDSMPDLKASISEQMSMSYAALDDKRMSDFYRNQYLDLQDSTRQDRQLEARLISLERVTNRIWLLVGVAVGVFLLLCILSYILVRLRHRKETKGAGTSELEAMDEDISALQLRYSDALRSMVEQRARVSIIKGMLSLIERMKHAVRRGDYDYVHAVAANIEQQNEMLTGWIKLSKGNIKPRIEDFPIAEVLDIVAQSAPTFATQGIRLNVSGSGVTVKADKILTLFIINTLVDNARKATEGSGEITVDTELQNGSDSHSAALRINVADTGKGMTEEQVSTLFDIKPILDDGKASSHGFGLQNCRGIIECYRKISSIFSVCSISVTSAPGKGTKVSFTLPAVIKTVVVLFMMLSQAVCLHAQVTSNIAALEHYADSLYQCNVQGRYAEASLYADTCKMFTHNSLDVAEEQTGTYLSIYNETAVAALALHQWHRYLYYNHLYAQLYKLSTQDKMLLRYCQDMERRRIVANISMLVVLLLIVSLFPLLWFIYLRPLLRLRSKDRRERERRQEQKVCLQREYSALHIQNNIIGNQLSSIKHETMYYPSRIKQLLASPQDSALQLEDTVAYYSSLYSALSRQAIAGDNASLLFPVKQIPLSAIIGADEVSESTKVIANGELMHYLLLLLKRHNGGMSPKVEVVTAGEGSGYVSLRFIMASASIKSDDITNLFANDTPHTDYLVMRQIVRETADATNAYGAGIGTAMHEGIPCIIVTLPAIQ